MTKVGVVARKIRDRARYHARTTAPALAALMRQSVPWRPRHFTVVMTFPRNSYVTTLVAGLPDSTEVIPYSSAKFLQRWYWRHADVFHVHWVEHMAGDLPDMTALWRRLRRHRVALVLTAHNLRPHVQRPGFEEYYQTWVDHAAGIIHHSDWSRDRFQQHYRIPPSAAQAVIAMGVTFDNDLERRSQRADLERSLGLPPARLRIGIVGAPRPERRVLDFLQGFARSILDAQVVCWSLGPNEVAPSDSRIAVAEQRSPVSSALWLDRLLVCDALAIPYQSDGFSLNTGVVRDVVGLELVALTSSWPFTTSYLGEGSYVVGDDPDTIAQRLSSLDAPTFARCQAAVAALRPHHANERCGELTNALYEAAVRTVVERPRG